MALGGENRSGAVNAWFVYLVRGAGGVIYTGIATDVDRRLAAHASGRGAKYLRGRGPLVVVYTRKLGEKGLALRVERRLKRLNKTQKEAIVTASPARRSLLRILELSARGTALGRHLRGVET